MVVQIAKVALRRLYGLSLHDKTGIDSCDSFVTQGEPPYHTKMGQQTSTPE